MISGYCGMNIYMGPRFIQLHLTKDSIFWHKSKTYMNNLLICSTRIETSSLFLLNHDNPNLWQPFDPSTGMLHQLWISASNLGNVLLVTGGALKPRKILYCQESCSITAGILAVISNITDFHCSKILQDSARRRITAVKILHGHLDGLLGAQIWGLGLHLGVFWGCMCVICVEFVHNLKCIAHRGAY